ncbi:MAG: hypothetical protein IPL52_14485 [Flavobacteriales bacterium]|nr:hypothetical protein [Flavobacteriales bacterium]
MEAAIVNLRNAFIALSVSVLMCSADPVRADHFSGTSITYECVGPDQYRFYLDLYLDCAGAAITNQTLHFSNDCGVAFSMVGLTPISTVEVSPLCPSQIANSRCNGGTLPSFRRHRFQTTLFLSPCDKWTVQWYTCCRNTTQNIFLQPGTYVEATFNNTVVTCDHSPRFVDSGIPYVCVNQAVAYNPGVTDANGNSLAFSLISARYGSPTPTDVLYQGSYSGSQPFLGATINGATGQLLFTPTVTGYYVVVIQVKSFNSLGQLIGTVMRDLMFAVIVCDGNPPASNGISSSTGGAWFQPFSVFACTGLSFCVNVPFYDFQGGTNITATTNATTVLPGSTVSISGTNPVVVQICWTGNESILPQAVWFQASDGACPIPNVMSMNIIVMNCATLPVEILAFSAKVEGALVRTTWTTASESGSDRFIVERGRDGAHFNELGSIDAAGNSQNLREYSFFDREPLPGTAYYRLREEDLDGTVAYSEVVSVHFGGSNTVRAISDGGTNWLVSGAAPNAPWSLRDTQGRLVAQGVFRQDSAAVVHVPSSATSLLLLVVEDERGPILLKLPPIVAGSSTEVSASAH